MDVIKKKSHIHMTYDAKSTTVSRPQIGHCIKMQDSNALTQSRGRFCHFLDSKMYVNYLHSLSYILNICVYF